METRASFALIGAFLLAAVAALAGFTMWLGQVQFQRDFAEYDVIFEGAVNGLGEGGEVRYLGIKVGEVANLSVDADNEQQVVARIRIDRATPVREDSTAILDFAGLTGVTFIQLRAGTPSTDLKPKRMGGTVPVIRTERTQLEAVLSGGQDLIANAQITLARLNMVLDEENTDALRATLQNLQTLTGALAAEGALITDARAAMGSLADAGEALTAAAASFEGLGTSLQGDVTAIRTEIDGLLGDARLAVQAAEATLIATGDAVTGTREALEAPSQAAVEEVRLMAQDMRMLINRLDRVVREVERNPQLLVVGDPKPFAEDGR